MKKQTLFFVAPLLFLISVSAEIAWGQDLYLEGTIESGVYTSPANIIVQNDGTINDGAQVYLIAADRSVLQPGFSVNTGGVLHIFPSDRDVLPDEWEMEHFGDLDQAPEDDPDNDYFSNLDEYTNNTDPNIWDPDNEAPVFIGEGYPANGSTVPNDGNPITMLYTFGDNLGVTSVTLVDGDLNDITDQATIDSNSIEYVIDSPENGTYQYAIILEDAAGNETEKVITFDVDTFPETTASVSGGSFSETFTVDLVCSEEATIHYSTDGYPPIVGADNTTSQTAPINGIVIDRSMKLQFFAVDTNDNAETIQSETYLFGAIPEAVTGLSGSYNDPSVELTWDSAAGSISGYHVYRCITAVDRQIINDSIAGGYPPPESLRKSPSLLTNEEYYDSDVIPGGTYYYGATVINSNGVEGVSSALEPVTVTSATTAQNKEEAIDRAVAWLESNQNEQGYWGADENRRILATSQVLSALKPTGKNDAGIRQAIFYLRGNFADNNDFLARKILTLHTYDQNVDEFVNRLISQSYISGNNIVGWGIQERFKIDAVDTSLGALAVECTTRSIAENNAAYYYLRYDSSLESSTADQFSWILGADPSIYVSSLVYYVVDSHYSSSAPNLDYQWIIGVPNSDGSFGDNLTTSALLDTSAVLLWLDVTQTVRDNASDYLVSQQSTNGSWNDDPYITGLCLEALQK